MTNSSFNKTILPWSLVAAMALVLLWLVYERVRLSDENKEFRAELETVQTDKEKVKQELTQMLAEYERMESSNSEINAELKKEREKIEQMLAQIRHIKASNTLEIEKYKRQIKTMRDVMQSFVRQIDSLNTKNQQLTAEVNRTNEKYQQTLGEKKQLESHSDSLSRTVRVAETLVAETIDIQTLNGRGSTTSRASKAKKVQVDFTLRDNPVAQRGNRTIYLRIFEQKTQDTQVVLTNAQQSGVADFSVNNSPKTEKLGFSASKPLMYDGNKTSGTVFFDFGAEVSPGSYQVEIYVGSKIAGVKNFNLK